MTPDDFAEMRFDVVLEFGVGFKEEPKGVILTLSHSPLPAALKREPPSSVRLLLTLDQADQLSELLAQKRHKAQPRRTSDA